MGEAREGMPFRLVFSWRRRSQRESLNSNKIPNICTSMCRVGKYLIRCIHDEGLRSRCAYHGMCFRGRTQRPRGFDALSSPPGF